MAERKALVLRIADGVIEELPSGDTLTGATGGSGAVILNGTVDPTTEGSDGDFYINTTTSTLFGPKATTWPAGVALIGADGADGAAGADGADGTNGVGVPVGGTTGQILAKIDATDYNTEWIDAPTGGGSTPVADTTDYVNEGGTGNRTAIITCTYRNGGASPAAMPAMVDGATASNAFYFGGGGFDRDLTFVFAEGKGIDEFKWYQSGSQTHGGWKMQGSNDGTNWTDISSEFTLGGASPSTHVMDLYDGTLYTQYRLIGVSGNADVGPWIYEIEFKIAGEAPVAPPVENLGDLTDVTVAGATTGQVLKKQGDGSYAFEDESGGTTLPTINTGDAGKSILINETEDGYVYGNPTIILNNDLALTVINGDFETGDLTGWTTVGNAPAIEARVGGTGTWSSEFDETYGNYLMVGGINSTAGAQQDIDITDYNSSTATAGVSTYTISSAIAVEDTGTADAVTFTATLLDNVAGTVDTASKTITGPADTMDLSDLVLTGDGTEVTLRLSVAFTKGGSGSYINAALDSVAASVNYYLDGGSGGGSGSTTLEDLTDTQIVKANLGASHTGQPVVWDNDLQKFVVSAPGFDTMKLGGGRELLFADLDMGTSSFLSLVLDESTYNIDEYDEIEVILYGANNSLTLEISADGGTTADNIRRWERYADATASTSLHTQTRLGSGVGTEAGAYVIATIKNHSDPSVPTTVESFGHSTTTALNAMQSYSIADTIQKHNALVFSMNNDTNATAGKLLIVGVKKSRQPLEYSGLLSAAWSAGATAIAGATAGMKVRAGTAGAVYLVGGTNAADTNFQVEDSSATVIATGTVTAGQTSAVLTASGENTITGPITVKGVGAGDSGVSAYVVIRGELA